MISMATEAHALSCRMLLASSSGMSSPRRLLSVCSANLGWRQEHKPTPRGHNRPHRHRDPCWSKLRGAKVFKVDVPDYEFQRRAALGKASPAEVRDELKKSGEAPLRERYTEKPLYLSCTGGVLDDYVPPEGDGKASVVSTEVSLLVTYQEVQHCLYVLSSRVYSLGLTLGTMKNEVTSPMT